MPGSVEASRRNSETQKGNAALASRPLSAEMANAEADIARAGTVPPGIATPDIATPDNVKTGVAGAAAPPHVENTPPLRAPRHKPMMRQYELVERVAQQSLSIKWL